MGDVPLLRVNRVKDQFSPLLYRRMRSLKQVPAFVGTISHIRVLQELWSAFSSGTQAEKGRNKNTMISLEVI